MPVGATGISRPVEIQVSEEMATEALLQPGRPRSFNTQAASMVVTSVRNWGGGIQTTTKLRRMW
jgi:hypothetical protein